MLRDPTRQDLLVILLASINQSHRHDIPSVLIIIMGISCVSLPFHHIKFQCVYTRLITHFYTLVLIMHIQKNRSILSLRERNSQIQRYSCRPSWIFCKRETHLGERTEAQTLKYLCVYLNCFRARSKRYSKSLAILGLKAMYFLYNSSACKPFLLLS